MTSPFSIPAEAVEAAWGSIGRHFDDTETESWKEEIRTALEAAAPHLLREAKAAAWDEGSWQGYREGADDELLLPAVDNPYRSQG